MILDHRLTLPDALQRVVAQTGVDLRHASARVGVGRGHLLEIVVQSGDFAVADEPLVLLACERLVELVLGSEVHRDWIGAIHSVPGPKTRSLRVASAAADVFFPLHDLVAAIDAGRSGILAGLDERPYHQFCEHAPWTLLDVEPEMDGSAPSANSADGGGVAKAQDDLVLCSTMLPEMMKCFLQNDSFSSRRFSRHGESFVYLKYAGATRSNSEARLAERGRLEDALNRALVPGAVGCVVGAGLGVSHGYIDLALMELDHGIALTRAIWQRAGCVGPAWMLFCDSARRRDWAAVSSTAPTPPGCDREIMVRQAQKGAQLS